MSDQVRVRYAPSPTGLQHIGGVRTALFNYFFARAMGGKFILRVEDTDRERTTDEAMEDLFSTLEWLGVDWDEGPLPDGTQRGEYGPYIQSERTELYREYTEKLIADGKAYKCFCTAERLQALREEQEKTKSKEKGYDRHCRTLSVDEVSLLEAEGKPYVVRLKVPGEGKTSFDDVLMGTITRKNKDVNPDPVLMKSDGFPTYHLANVIDDHLMGITHIMRAQEWIPSGPLHVILYEAFCWEPPKYCHLPMVMGKDGQKLSKRHGSTAVRDFRKEGYLPEAVTNYVSLLGWSFDGKTEFFSREELEKVFSLEKINKAPGVFDYRKLEWFNGNYIRRKSGAELKELLIPYLTEEGVIAAPPSAEESQMLDNLIPLVHERLKKLSDITPMTKFLFREIESPDEADLIPKKKDRSEAADLLKKGRELLVVGWEQSNEELEESFRTAAEEMGAGLGALLMPLRAAVTGSKISPPLFEALRLLGKERMIARIDKALEILS